MKKGKVLTKSQIALVAMVLLLGAAVWLNTKYAGQKTRYMGEATLVSSETDQPAVPASASIENDYFTTAAAEREEAYKDAEETVKETLDNVNATDTQKTAAAESSAALAERKMGETAVENLLKAKGFEKSLVTISNSAVTVVVKSDGLTAAETVQIQDAVTSLCGVSLNNIKIVTVDS